MGAGGAVSPDTGAGEWHEAAAAALEAPAKFVLYRPMASHLLAVLATACEALPPVSALLIYLSASGAPCQSSCSRRGGALCMKCGHADLEPL